MRPALRLVLTTLLLAHGCETARPITPGTPNPSSDGGTTTPGAAPALLAAGDIDRAHTVFVGGSSPSDDAGACLTRILRLTESAAGTQILGVLGWPRLAAHEILGPDSIVARVGKRYNGTAQVVMPGRTVALPRARVDVGGRAVALDLASGSRADVVGLPSPGSSVQGSIDCSTGMATFPGISYVSFNHDDESCFLSTLIEPGPGCSTDGGSFSVSSGRVGDDVRVRLENVPLDCTLAGRVRVSMRFDATLSDQTADPDWPTRQMVDKHSHCIPWQ